MENQAVSWKVLLVETDAFTWTEAADESRRLDCTKWRGPSSCQQSSLLVPVVKSGPMGAIEVKLFDPGLDRTSPLSAESILHKRVSTTTMFSGTGMR